MHTRDFVQIRLRRVQGDLLLTVHDDFAAVAAGAVGRRVCAAVAAGRRRVRRAELPLDRLEQDGGGLGRLRRAREGEATTHTRRKRPPLLLRQATPTRTRSVVGCRCNSTLMGHIPNSRHSTPLAASEMQNVDVVPRWRERSESTRGATSRRMQRGRLTPERDLCSPPTHPRLLLLLLLRLTRRRRRR